MPPPSRKTLLQSALLLFLCAHSLRPLHAEKQFENWDLARLEDRLSTIDTELSQLPTMTMRTDSGTIGYRSDSPLIPNPGRSEWVQIDFGTAQAIDEIVLVPIIRHDSKNGYHADGFPHAFDIIAGTDNDPDGQLIARFNEADQLLPRTAPVVTQFKNLQASWIRIVATKLSTRGWDGVHVFQLAEVMIFRDGKNIAFGKPVTASSTSPGPNYEHSPYNTKFLVDGFAPYMMDGYQGTKSRAYYSNFPIGTVPVLTIDLQQVYRLHQVNFHAIEISDTIPQSNPDAFATPREFRLEASQRADFSDATELIHYRMLEMNNRGPIIQFQFPAGDYRYLRFTFLKTDQSTIILNTIRGILGIAEIEVLSGGTNVALGKPVTVEAEGHDPDARNDTVPITDGHNFYGRILPDDEWMRQLARRHDLEVERPHVLTAINQGYARQKTILRVMVYLVATLAGGIVIIYLIGRMRAMRDIAHIRKRFAADLHDQLGANLHAIGLLSDLAYDAVDEKEKLRNIVSEVRAVTERTNDAVRYCANSQEARDPMGSLTEDMHRIAKRMMHDLDYSIKIEGETFLQKLKLRTRNDLFLFYKECLVNISRHSGATAFTVQLTANAQRIQLNIEDNGQGYAAKPGAEVPPSLRRRAQLMRAQLQLHQPEKGGTLITLELKRRQFLFFTR